MRKVIELNADISKKEAANFELLKKKIDEVKE